jgi:copper transport protein
MTTHVRRRALLTIAALFILASPLLAHTALNVSFPAKDEVLDTSPAELILIFTERIDLRLARVRLLDAEGAEILLGELHAGDSVKVVVAPVAAPLSPGNYTVAWQVMGTDGHPVRGQFSFVVAARLEADTAVTTPASSADPGGAAPLAHEEPSEGERMSAGSPTFVAVRWLTYAVIMVAIGAIGFRFVVLSALRRSVLAGADAVFAVAASRAAAIARGALGFLILAAGARLLAQATALGVNGDETGGMMSSLVLGTLWGRAWLLQVAVAVAGMVAFHAARRGSANGWAAAAGLALLLALSQALSGHAAAVERLTAVAVVTDTVHLLAVSLWLGTLLFVVGLGVPEATRTDPVTAPTTIAAMVGAFSPAALIAAGVVVLSGTLSAVFQLYSLTALWASDYGRMLLLKICIVLLVMGFGAYNWQRVKPRLAAVGSEQLRRSATLELAAGAVVLLITAVLVALPTP